MASSQKRPQRVYDHRLRELVCGHWRRKHRLCVRRTAFLVLCVITYVFFVSGERLVRYIGDNGVKVITRLMGLILAVIGVQMLIHGIGGAVTAFTANGVTSGATCV